MYVNHVYLAKWLKNSEFLSVILLLVIAKCDWQFWVTEYNYLPFGTWTLKLIRPSISRLRQHYVFYLEDSKWGQQSPVTKRWAVFPDYRELQDSRPQNFHQGECSIDDKLWVNEVTPDLKGATLFSPGQFCSRLVCAGDGVHLINLRVRLDKTWFWFT